MSRTRLRMLLLVIVLLGWGLRLWRLDDQELRGDETFGYFFSLRPTDELVQATIDLQEPHPVASYMIQHHWLAWSGHSEFALRFTSVWFGLLAVVLLWRLARALNLTANAALLATLLLAISSYAIWHSQDARMYSMSMALTLASTWLMIGWLQRQHWRWAIAYVLISLWALHTHYFSAFVVVAQNLFILLRTIWQPRLRFTLSNWLVLPTTIVFFYGPWLLRVSATLSSYHGNGDSPRLAEMLRRAGSVLLVGESIPSPQQLWWALLAGLLLIWGMIQLARSGPNGHRALLLLLLYLGVPLFATWWSAQTRPIFNERYLIAAAPPFYLLIAAILHSRTSAKTGRIALSRRFLVSVPILLVLGGMSLSLGRHYTDPAYSKTRGWRTLATILAQLSANLPPEQVRIAQNFPDPTLWYYYTGAVGHVVLPPAPQDRDGAHTSVEQLQTAGVTRVLLPRQPAPNWDDQDIAATALATSYRLVHELSVGVWPLQIYGAPPTVLTPIKTLFDNGVTLTEFAVQPATLSPGNVLTIHLGWQGDSTRLTGQEKVFVQLLDATGHLVAQADQPLMIPPNAPTMVALATYGILLPNRLSTGPYQLIAGLYDPAQAGMPRILTEQATDAVTLLAMPAQP